MWARCSVYAGVLRCCAVAACERAVHLRATQCGCHAGGGGGVSVFATAREPQHVLTWFHPLLDGHSCGAQGAAMQAQRAKLPM